MAYDPTAAAGAAPSWTVPEKFLSWDVDHTRFEMKRVLGKGESLLLAETAGLVGKASRSWREVLGGPYSARPACARPLGARVLMCDAATRCGLPGRQAR